ncbi:MAG: 3-isopropylmalate dehydratase small subunit [Anaerolineae bacterium]|jgi:3-isopropylmalate/(R)-2-methylmalate dehydratase small subunit|nr:3-isopropylmalate dehydratase small subunit [Anaerolineae bacterium]MBT4312397.1 3-isopropylmalate dehydratase small subunit [Anaerolineae bacterium]MBT4459355.1 3-isopropylmalate dehydratase small subunit [Anaerolineae bacterium]MBT6062279.1 3-isopropylmalate dehydratase small subunit [Anaerolineae bacterium]MBT6320918.1 3-isopropylmalate dehydratase small subunit [Anaerolineae bacterium]
MKSFTKITSKIIPLPHTDVDTDQIIPARYLKVINKDGLAEGLFDSWRKLPDGSPNPDFPLNQDEYQGAEILLAGDNFGCGSSREHAPWALTGWGIRAIISTSFADIFRNNALKNGLLPIVVSEATQTSLFDLSEEAPSATIDIDLASQTLTLPDGSGVSFELDSFNKTCLLEGIDQLGYLLKHEAEIAAFEESRLQV